MKANCALVVLRIFLGAMFALGVWPKLSAGSAFPAILQGFLQHVAMSNAPAFYQAFLTSTVLPNIGVFAGLIVVGEVCLAVALITGTATRLAGVIAIVHLTNYMFAKGMWWWFPASNDAADSIIALALIIGAAGRTLGVDAWLAKRWPHVPLW